MPFTKHFQIGTFSNLQIYYLCTTTTLLMYKLLIRPILFRFDPEEVHYEYAIRSYRELPDKKYDAAVLAVGHNAFVAMNVHALLTENHVIYDVKGLWPKDMVDARL